MSQAKVLTEKEVRKVLLYIASRKHATRNRAMFVVLNATGMRVKKKKYSLLRFSDREYPIRPKINKNAGHSQ
mgnify:CR=1 FL=1